MKYVESNINLRNMVVGVDNKIQLKGNFLAPINFDNAATTPPFKAVIDEILEFSPLYSSIHRGLGYKSELSSNLYDNSRHKIAAFVGADIDTEVIIYVKNTTEAINKLSYKLCTNKKEIVLCSDMEHHSNDLPWRDKFTVDYIPLLESGALSLQAFEKKLKKYSHRIKLVAITGASNVTGIRNPIYDMAELAHKYGAKIFVDCAQLIPHSVFDMKPHNSKAHIDFLAFSSHKMYAPFGIGVLIGDKEVLNIKPPEYKGGGTVKIVTHNYIGWENTPSRDEAGTPNVIGVVALTKAIDVINSIGMHNIERHEQMLTSYAYDKLKKLPDIELYTNCIGCQDRIGIIPFNVKGLSHDIVAKALAFEEGISVRNGCFCAQPYIQKLLKLSKKDLQYYIKNQTAQRPGMVRISFGLYNTLEEINCFDKAIKEIIENKEYYHNRYGLRDSSQILNNNI